MQFQVPQNITMEDKIVGPLGALQFGIVVIGSGLSFIIATSLNIPSPLNDLLGIFSAILTVTLAVGKFNGQPMYHFIKFIIVYLTKPRIRVWHKQGSDIQLVQPNIQSAEKDHMHLVKNVSKSEISRLATVLDTRGVSGIAPKIKITVQKNKTESTP